MNAPATQAAVAVPKPILELLPLAAIQPSTTHIQELRRSHFDKKALQDLADSIKQVGVLQPVVVRPLGLANKFELVAGERRWIAAKLAGLAEIRASVCTLTPEQVLEIQLVENLQREGLHELEEAEGYDELMKLKKINADQVAEMVGKSRSYVYARTKLLALCPEARKDFYAGEMDASTALQIARIPHHDIQKKAMTDITKQRCYGELSNFKEVQAFIRDHYMLRLKQAPFDPKAEGLVPKAGSCTKCPKRTGNQADLFGDVKDADLCTDAKCFDEKRQAHFSVARKALEAKGKRVIHGDAAKKAMPYWDEGSTDLQGYTELSDRVHDKSGGVRKVADVVGKDYESLFIQHPGSGKLIEVATSQAVAKASGKKGTVRAGSYAYDAAERRRKAKGPDVDEMLTERLARLIHEKAPKQFGKAWLLDLARVVFEKLNLRDEDAVAKAFGWPASAFSRGYGSKLPAQAEKLDERGLVLLMFEIVFATRWGRERVQKLFGIKEQEVREQIIEERRLAKQKEREDARAKKEAKAARSSPVAKVNAAIDKRAANSKAKKKATRKKK